MPVPAPRSAYGPRRAVLHRLLLSTALIGGMSLLPQQVAAQALPVVNPVGGDGGATITPNAIVNPTVLEVDLEGQNRIINWLSFNIGANRIVNFTGADGARLTAINRVGPLAPSTINGTINATNINVWLINPEGVTFGRTGSFSGGGLVLSTIPLQLSAAEERAFLADGGSLPGTLQFNAGGGSASEASIRFVAGGTAPGTITANGSIVAIAQRIENDKTLTATGGSVALVAASDVTFNSGIDNPLSITINAGTVLGTAQIAAGGVISGGSVVIAGGAQTAVTGALLGVTATQLTATAANGAIVIATAPTTVGGSVLDIVNGVAGDPPVTPGISVNSALNASGATSDVILNAAGALSITGGSAQATRDVSFGAGAAITAGGAVTAGRDYLVSGGGVTLGRAGATPSQVAGGQVTISSTDGDITGLAGLILQSNSASPGTEALTLSAPDGIVTFAGTTQVIGGRSDARSDVLVASSGAVTLGSVVGRSLRTIGDADNLLVTSGAFAAAAIDVLQPLGIRSDSSIAVAGDVIARGVGSGVDLRGTSVAVGGITRSNGGDIFVSATGDLSLAGATTTLSTTVDPTLGSIGLLAGGNVLMLGALGAGEDVAVRAGGTAGLAAVLAGDDADLTAVGALTLSRVETTGTGADARAVTFDPALAGTGGIAAAGPEDAALAGSNIRLAAASIASGTGAPALTGSTDSGLVIEELASASAVLLADRLTALGTSGDIRIGQAVTDAGDLTVTAGDGSVSGLASGWVNSAGGSELVTTGNVSITTPGAVTIGLIDAGGSVSGTGALGQVRIRRVEGDTLDLTAIGGLQIGSVDVVDTVALTDLGGTPGAFSQTATTLVGAHGRANLNGGGALTVTALSGAAQLGATAGDTIDIRGDALDVTSATARTGSLFLLAESGRLSLGTGLAATTTALAKRDDDAVAGTPAAVADALFVTTSLTGGTGVDVRSASDASVVAATATTGNLAVQAARDAALGTGTATVGTLALLAGRNAASATRLAAGEDVSVDASGLATLSALQAGDDIDLRATGTLFLTTATTLGTGPDTRAVTFTPALAGLGDPLVAGTGGIAIGAPEEVALIGSNIRLRADSVAGPGLTGSTDAGLVLERLTSAIATVTADLGDIRIGAAATNGALDVAAGAGSISGLRTGWVTSGGGSTLTTPGSVSIAAPNGVSIGTIDAGGAVFGDGAFSSARFGRIDADSLSLTAINGLQLGTAIVTGTADLRVTGGSAAAFDAVATPLVAGYGAADLNAGGTLTVAAPTGAAQLGATFGSSIDVQADAIDVVSATARTGSLFLLAERGRLTLGTGSAATSATVWTRDDDAVADTPAAAGDALFVTTALTGGTGVDVRSATDATVAGATATTGNLTVQAARDASLGTGNAVAGTLALLAGRNAGSATRLAAFEDVSINAGGAATLRALEAGDDIDLLATGTVFLTAATTLGTGADTGAVTFTPAQAGLGDPRVAGTGGIAIGAPGDAALIGTNIRIRAAAIAGPGLTGSIDAGLVVEGLTSASATITADTSDIRIGSAATDTGGLGVTAGAGSISGLRDGWVPTSGGSIVTTPGTVLLSAPGAISIGTIDAGSVVSDSVFTTGRFGRITAASLDLVATEGLQIGTVNVASAANLRTLGGTPAAIDVIGAPIVAGYRGADLDARGALTVDALLGAAQLGTTLGSSIAIRADAVGIGSATARDSSLFVLAERGRLSLGTGRAATTATLAKRDDDAVAGTPAAAADALFVTTALTGGTGVDVRSATDATLLAATATTGDLKLQAARDASLGTGNAIAGTLALLAGRNAGSATRLAAFEDVSVDAGGNASLGLLQAGDDIDLRATGSLSLTDATTLGTGPDNRAVTFTPAQAGLGNPLVAGTGGIAIGAPESAALVGSTIRIRAGTVTGSALTGSTDAGLVIESLTSGSATITADLGDIRIGSAVTSGGALDVSAGAGSISGLRDGWVATAGGATLNTPGGVIIEASNAATFGNISAGGAVVSSGTIGSARFGRIVAAELDLSATGGLQIGSAQVGGAATLRTTGGSAAAIDPIATPLVAGYGAARLAASGDLSVGALRGAAQLGEIDGASVSVAADAVDVVDAASTTTLSLLAEAGHLTLGTGVAGTGATLVKRDDDAVAGVVAASADALFVTGSITGGSDATITSATDATIELATATSGNLSVETGRDAVIRGGLAGTDLSVTAGRDVVSAVELTGGQNLTIDALGSATIASATATDAALAITARNGALSLGTGTARTVATLTKLDTDGVVAVGDALFVTGSITGGSDVAIFSATDATISQATATLGNLSVTTGRDALVATGIAGTDLTIDVGRDATSALTLTAGRDLAIDAVGRATITSATASSGALAITTGNGPLTLGVGVAGTSVTLTKLDVDGGGAADDALFVTESVTGGTDVSIVSATDAAVVLADATAGALLIEAGRDAVIDRGGAGTDMSISAGRDAISTIDLTAGNNLTINAGGPAGIANATAQTGALGITTQNGPLTLGIGIAGTSVTLTKLDADGGGAADDALFVTNSVTGGTDVSIVSATDATVSLGTAMTGNLLVDAGGDAVVVTGVAGGDLTMRAGRDASSSDQLSAGRNITIDAGGAASIERAAAASGALAITTQRGALTLGLGTAGTNVSLTKFDVDGGGTPDDALFVTGSVTGGVDVTIRSATDATINQATATGGNMLVVTGRDAIVSSGTAGGNLVVNAGRNASSDIALVGGEDVTIDAIGDATIVSATATRGALAITTQLGALTLDNGVAGAGVTLTKLGAVDGLTVTEAVTGGTDVTIDSATNATIELATATAGNLLVNTGGNATVRIGRAGTDIGIGAGVDVVSDTELTAGRNVSVAAIGSADIVNATAVAGALAISTQQGVLTLGTGFAGANVTLTKAAVGDGGASDGLFVTGSVTGGGDVTIDSATDATIELATATVGNLLVTTDRNAIVRIGRAGTDIGIGAGVDVISDTELTAGRNVSVAAIGNVDIANATAVAGNLAISTQRGALTLGTGIAGANVTLTKAAIGGGGASDGLFVTNSVTGGTDVTIASATDATIELATATAGNLLVTTDGTAVVRIGRAGADMGISAGADVVSDTELTAGRNIAVDAGGSAAVVAATATSGNLAIATLTGPLTLDTGVAGADITLTTRGLLGGLTVTEFVTGGDDVAISSATDATIERATATAGTLLVNAAGDALARTGVAGTDLTVIAGGDVRSDIELTAGQDLTVDAGRSADILAATATDGTLAITTRSGALTLGTGLAGTSATLTKLGLVDALSVTGSLTAGTDATIRSATSGTVREATATAGNLLVVTGDDANVSTASAGTDLTVNAGGDVISDISLTGGRNVTIDAGGSAEILAATATGGALAITTRSGALTLGTGIAGTSATLTKFGADGGILVTGSLTAGTDAAIFSETFATVSEATASAGDLLIETAGDANLSSVGAGTDLTVTAGGDVVSDIGLTGGQNVTIDAGGSAAIATAAATRGALAITTRSGALTLGTGVAGTSATLTKLGAVDALSITGSLTAGTDATIRSDTSAAVREATATAGNLLVTTGGDAVLATGAAGTDLTINAGGDVVSDLSLSAGRNVSVTAVNEARIATAAANGGALAITTQNGGLTLGTGTAGTSATLTKLGTADGLFVTGSLTAGTDVTIRSATTATVNRAEATAGALVATTGSDATVTTGVAGTDLTITAGRDVTSGDILAASRNATIDAGGSATIANAAAIGGALAITARQGSLSLGTGRAGAGVVLATRNEDGVVSAGEALGVTGSVTGGTDVTIRSATAATVNQATATGGNLLVETVGDASVRIGVAGSDLVLTAGGNAASDTALTASGNLTVNATGGATIAIANATATRGALAITTRTAGLSLGTGVAGTSATLTKLGTTDGLFVTNALTAGGDVTLRSATAATVNQATATGGALLVDAGTDAIVRTGSAGTDATVTAARDATSDRSLTAGRNIAVQAGQSARITAATARAGTLAITATTGELTLGIGNAGTTATLTKRGGTSGLTIGTGLTAGSNVTLDSSGAIEVSGPVTASGAGGTITAINNGSGATAIGGAAGAAGFALSEAEVNRLRAANVVVDSLARDVSIGKLAIEGGTGSSALRFYTVGSAAVTGAVSGGGTGTLQIGGRSGAEPSGLVDAATLARRVTADVAGASIAFANGTVDLRAQRVTFGSGFEFNTYVGLTNAEVARIVANAGSALYNGNTSRADYLVAKKLTVSYADFALFQNTKPGVAGGVILNAGAANSVEATALQLYSTGDFKDNSFAVFGTVNGFVGRAAGVLPNEVLNIADLNPRTLRITQSNSRVNGCVIGSPDRGCLITDVPRTEFRLYDERQTQLFTTADDASLYANPLVGRGNEGLIVDIADVPVGIDTIECPEDEPNCRTPGSPR